MLTRIEQVLDQVLPPRTERPSVLAEAIRWAVEGGGKRVRPQICCAAAVAVGGTVEDALMPACAIELLHSYTLVHDDLPAMDNDVERRGKPSVWAKFGEANAILAGDALQALAFGTAARAPRNAAAIVAALAQRGVGVVAGQIEDLVLARAKDGRASSTAQADRASSTAQAGAVDFVYEHKTADLFMAAAVMGALAGDGTAGQVEQLRQFAYHLGLAFQFEDDLLDGDSPYSREETERLVIAHTQSAIAALAGLPGDTSFLSSLANSLVGRSR